MTTTDSDRRRGSVPEVRSAASSQSWGAPRPEKPLSPPTAAPAASRPDVHSTKKATLAGTAWTVLFFAAIGGYFYLKWPATTEADRQAQEAADHQCRYDMNCWSDRHEMAANIDCRPYIERLAKHDFEWTDGFGESKFSRVAWANKSKGTVRYFGDKVKFQNGFGAWTPHTYECEYDPTTRSVLNVSAIPGRI